MSEDAVELAPSTQSCCVSSLSTKETISELDEERQVIIESMAESSESSCPEEKSLPRTRYATFIVKHPFLIFGLISLLVILSGCVSLIPQLGAMPLPNFNEPIKGFEARGTIISDRWRSQMNLFHDEHKGEVSRVPARCKIKNPIGEQQIGDAPAICSKEQTFNQGKLTMKLVFGEKNGRNLLTAKNLKSVCRLEEKIVRRYHNFDVHCHKANGTEHCCPSWSVGYYIALLNEKGSCLNIDETDVNNVSNLLKKCSKFYHNGTLKPDCWDFMKSPKGSGRCNQVPDSCTKFNAVYNILHYLTDKHFLSDGRKSSLFLRYSLVLVPVKEDKEFQVEIYKSHLKDDDITDGNVVLSAFELSKLKFEIFNEKMMADLYLAGIAMFFIMVILWVYTRSFLITSLVGLIVVSSLVIAYFVYSVVLRMKFFPFLNILTSIFLVGIAADDAFVYIDIWNQAMREHKAKRGQALNKEERQQELIRITSDTMKHASLSMFVTSFTTSSAFFASLTSEITSIRLFGLYSGLSILCMFFLMVTWFPAAVIIEQTVFSRFACCSALCGKLQINIFKGTCGIINRLVEWHRTFFTDFLPRMVIKLRYFWLVFLFLLAVGGIVVSTVEPGLQLPSSEDFQIFHESHVLEKYPLKLKKNFHFETTKRSSFPINIIWGIKAADTGDQFDPYDSGKLNWDNDFDIASKEGQGWIVKFLRRLKKQPFFSKDQKLGNACFIEEFFTFMKMNCTKDNRICCKDSIFPFNSSVFSECMLRMQCQKIKESQYSSHSITDGAPLFDSNGQLRAISLKFDSNVAFTWSYDPADTFWKETDNWANREFTNAPSTANGWFISELQFYDLQKSLSKGTLLSMSISLAIAFGVMLITTGNIHISVFAIVTITCALGVTVGSLVLMGWKLNILESITLSVSVGLSVDFALHYGVAYVLAVDKTGRKTRVCFSMTGMSSAITMAAFTTFVTGVLSSQSNVLSYIQLGQFLMIIMSVSWVYATFFFQALCSIFGPENDSGQMTISKFKAGYRRLRECFCRANSDSDHYQIVRKEDGTKTRKPVRVLYVK